MGDQIVRERASEIRERGRKEVCTLPYVREADGKKSGRREARAFALISNKTGRRMFYFGTRWQL